MAAATFVFLFQRLFWLVMGLEVEASREMFRRNIFLGAVNLMLLTNEIS